MIIWNKNVIWAEKQTLSVKKTFRPFCFHSTFFGCGVFWFLSFLEKLCFAFKISERLKIITIFHVIPEKELDFYYEPRPK